MEEFVIHRGFDPKESLAQSEPESFRWMLPIEDGLDLEVLLENYKKPSEATIYMGVNVATVPVRATQDFLAAALEVADGLVGTKLSLVGHFLVLSASFSLSGLDVDDLDYYFSLIAEQLPWFKTTLSEELGVEELPSY